MIIHSFIDKSSRRIKMVIIAKQIILRFYTTLRDKTYIIGQNTHSCISETKISYNVISKDNGRNLYNAKMKSSLLM